MTGHHTGAVLLINRIQQYGHSPALFLPEAAQLFKGRFAVGLHGGIGDSHKILCISSGYHIDWFSLLISAIYDGLVKSLQNANFRNIEVNNFMCLQSRKLRFSTFYETIIYNDQKSGVIGLVRALVVVKTANSPDSMLFQKNQLALYKGSDNEKIILDCST
jgi:hypothetical protein